MSIVLVLYCVCLWRTCCYPNWGFSVLFPSVVRQMPGYNSKRRGTASNSQISKIFYCYVCLYFLLLCMFIFFIIMYVYIFIVMYVYIFYCYVWLHFYCYVCLHFLLLCMFTFFIFTYIYIYYGYVYLHFYCYVCLYFLLLFMFTFFIVTYIYIYYGYVYLHFYCYVCLHFLLLRIFTFIMVMYFTFLLTCMFTFLLLCMFTFFIVMYVYIFYCYVCSVPCWYFLRQEVTVHSWHLKNVLLSENSLGYSSNSLHPTRDRNILTDFGIISCWISNTPITHSSPTCWLIVPITIWF
jgi:hypothetical protein